MKQLALIILCIYCLQNIAISQVACNDITKADIEVFDYNCDAGTVSFCLPIAEQSNFDILLNGNVQTVFGGCGEPDRTISYSIPNAQIGTLPFVLDSWIVNGVSYSGSFMNTQTLLESMNVWDAPNIWEFAGNNSNFVSKNPTNEYSDLFIFIPSTGILIQASIDETITPSSISVASQIQANYFFEITNTAENCTDTIIFANTEVSAPYDCQDFAPLGAQWHFSDFTDDGSNTLYTRIESDRDTSVNSPSGILNKVKIIEVYKNETHIPEARTFLGQKDNKVYYYEFGQFTLLYDFNLEAGDTTFIQVPTNRIYYDFFCTNNEEEYYYESNILIVDSVSYIEIQEEQLKVLHTRTEKFYDYQNCFEFGKITQRIGSEYGLFGRNFDQCSNGFPGKIRCYSDGLLDFKDFNEDCDFDGLDTSTENKQRNSIELYPNPTDGDLFLDTKANIKAYRIIDISGKVLIEHGNLVGDRIQINSLAIGIYFLELIDPTGNLMLTKKIVKR